MTYLNNMLQHHLMSNQHPMSCLHVLSMSITFPTVDRDMPSDPKATIEMKIKELESEV